MSAGSSATTKSCVSFFANVITYVNSTALEILRHLNSVLMPLPDHPQFIYTSLMSCFFTEQKSCHIMRQHDKAIVHEPRVRIGGAEVTEDAKAVPSQ